MSFRFHIPQYLSRRAADWQARGFTETLSDFAALNRRSKFWGDDGRAAFRNWEEVTDPRNKLGGRQGVDERIMLRELLRRVDMMVMLENRLDALVRLHTPLPPAQIGGAPEPGVRQNLRLESFYGPNAGLTEVLIPAGYVTTVYDPVFKLSPDRHALPLGRCRHADHDSGSRDCRSRWCSAPSRAARTCCCASRPPTRPPPSAASRRRHSALCHEVVIARLAVGRPALDETSSPSWPGLSRTSPAMTEKVKRIVNRVSGVELAAPRINRFGELVHRFRETNLLQGDSI